MKAKDMAARFGAAAFGKVALVAAAFCMAATSALADVTLPQIVSHRGESTTVISGWGPRDFPVGPT